MNNDGAALADSGQTTQGHKDGHSGGGAAWR